LLGGDFFWRRQRFASAQDRADMQALGLYVKGKSRPATVTLDAAQAPSGNPG